MVLSVTSVVLNTVFYITGEILISSRAELYVQTLKIIVITWIVVLYQS